MASADEGNSPRLHDDDNIILSPTTTSPRTLICVVRGYQLEKNIAEEEVRNLRRKLEEVADDNGNNTGDNERHSKRRRSNAPNSDEDDEEDDDEAVRQAGHYFLLICGPWLRRGEKIFQTVLNENYDEKSRFENAENKIQGQLCDIRSVLDKKFHDNLFTSRWLSKLFLKGMNAQRSNTSTRLRHQCAAIFGVDPLDMLHSTTRHEKFRKRIGWIENDQGVGSYSSVDVEILHKNNTREYDIRAAFLNPILMQLFVAIIRGPNAAMGLMKGASSQPKTETMEHKHGIRHTTPGAIATTVILARWALSADECLQERGATTGIHYMGDYEEYLEILLTGLQGKKKSILNVFREWDHIIFPNSDSSLVKKISTASGTGLKKAMDMLDADSEEEDTCATPSNGGDRTGPGEGESSGGE